MALDYILFTDLETSGTKSSENAILQAAAVITTPPPLFKIRSYWMSYCKPPKDLIIEPEALKVNGLKLEDLEDAPDEDAFAISFQSLTYQHQDLTFGGFYCSFDLGFLDAQARRTQIFPRYKVPSYDVHQEAKKKIRQKDLEPFVDPKKPKSIYTLVGICKFMGFATTGAHDGAVDIYNTIKVARKLAKMPYLSQVA